MRMRRCRRLCPLLPMLAVAVAIAGCQTTTQTAERSNKLSLEMLRPNRPDYSQGALGVLLQGLIQAGIEASESEERVRRFEALRARAEGGDAAAQSELATMYLNCYGKGLCKTDRGQAAQWFEKAAEQGDGEAMFGAGLSYAACGTPKFPSEDCKADYAKAIPWLRQAAEHGHLRAQVLLGKYYADPTPEFVGMRAAFGIEPDLAEGARWHEMAAAQGHFASMLDLASIYERGPGGSPDYARAAEWYRAAAERNHEVAQFRLGEYYEKGRGVPEDASEAHFWYYLASLRLSRGTDALLADPEDTSMAGFIESEARMAGLKARKLSGGQAQEAERRARKWLQAHPAR